MKTDWAESNNTEVNAACAAIDVPSGNKTYTDNYDSIMWLLKRQKLDIQDTVLSEIMHRQRQNGAIPHPRAWCCILLETLEIEPKKDQTKW